jgi:hypothetical protein
MGSFFAISYAITFARAIDGLLYRNSFETVSSLDFDAKSICRSPPGLNLCGTRVHIEAIDVVRGVIMVLTAIDHTRDFFGAPGVSPTDLARTTVSYFFMRWITHFSAPVSSSRLTERSPIARCTRNSKASCRPALLFPWAVDAGTRRWLQPALTMGKVPVFDCFRVWACVAFYLLFRWFAGLKPRRKHACLRYFDGKIRGYRRTTAEECCFLAAAVLLQPSDLRLARRSSHFLD